MATVEEQQLPPPVPHKNVPRRDSPTIQSIVAQKPNSHLSYSKYILLTDSLDIDEEYDDIASFLNEGSIDLRTSLFGKPPSASGNGPQTSAPTSAQVATLVSAPVSSPVVLEAKPILSPVPVITKREEAPVEQKRTGPGRPRGSATRKNYEEDDDEAVGSGKRKHSPQASAPLKRQHRDKDDDEDDDDDLDGEDNSAAHGASGGADDTDEIEFKPRASSTRGAAKREVRSSGTLTRTASSNNTAATGTGNAPTGRKVGRPPNSANSSTSSLPLPVVTTGGSTTPASSTAASPQTRRGPGRPPKRQLPMPDGSVASSSASNLNDAEEVEIKLGAPVSPLSSQGSQSLLAGESSQDSSQPKGISKTSSSGSVPTKVPKRRGRPRKQYVADGEEEEEDADASEQAEERSHVTITVSHPSEFDSVLEHQLKNRASKDTAIFVYLFGNRDARKGESWCPECAQSDPIIKATLAQRSKWVLIECPVGERSEYKNKPEHPYRLHRKIQLKAIPTLIKWGNERPRAQLVEYECHQPKTLEEFILKDKESH